MYAIILWSLLFLLCLRVLGQVLVAAADVGFLPPMREWYSGLIPYPILLPLQVVIILLLAKVSTDFTRCRGEFLRSKRRYDPDERFQSDWYRHYKSMFAHVL